MLNRLFLLLVVYCLCLKAEGDASAYQDGSKNQDNIDQAIEKFKDEHKAVDLTDDLDDDDMEKLSSLIDQLENTPLNDEVEISKPAQRAAARDSKVFPSKKWRRRGWRAPRIAIRIPRVRIPRVRIPRIKIPTFRLPRIPRVRLHRIIRIPRIRLPRVRLPRLPKFRVRLRFRIRKILRRPLFRLPFLRTLKSLFDKLKSKACTLSAPFLNKVTSTVEKLKFGSRDLITQLITKFLKSQSPCQDKIEPQPMPEPQPQPQPPGTESRPRPICTPKVKCSKYDTIKYHLYGNATSEQVGYIPSADSGVNIATGVDLGQFASIREMPAGIPQSVLNKFRAYFGLETQKKVIAAGLDPKNLKLTKSEADAVDRAFFNKIIRQVEPYDDYLTSRGSAVLASLVNWAGGLQLSESKGILSIKTEFGTVNYIYEAIRDYTARNHDIDLALRLTLELHQEANGGSNNGIIRQMIYLEILYLEKK